MKIFFVFICSLFLTSCSQDLKSYVGFDSNHHCKILKIAKNHNNINKEIYAEISGWLAQELPKLGYQVVDNDSACGEVHIQYSVNKGLLQSTHQLSVELLNLLKNEVFLKVSTDLDSAETNIFTLLPQMQNALYNKFLPAEGPHSHVKSMVKTDIFAN